MQDYYADDAVIETQRSNVTYKVRNDVDMLPTDPPLWDLHQSDDKQGNRSDVMESGLSSGASSSKPTAVKGFKELNINPRSHEDIIQGAYMEQPPYNTEQPIRNDNPWLPKGKFSRSTGGAVEFSV